MQEVMEEEVLLTDDTDKMDNHRFIFFKIRLIRVIPRFFAGQAV